MMQYSAQLIAIFMRWKQSIADSLTWKLNLALDNRAQRDLDHLIASVITLAEGTSST